MELRELRVLVAIADHGGVAGAARALHQSPSTVSHALAALETDVGVRLFHRVARGMVATEAGQAMLGPARRALREADAARAAAAAVDGLLAGQLGVVSMRMMAPWLADLIADFHTAYPLVVVRVHEPEREEAIPDLLRTGECDLGIMRADAVPTDLHATVVGTESGAVIAPADHPLAARSSVTVRDLDGLPFVVPPARLGPRFEALFADGGIVPRVVAEADHGETILELVRAGLGIAVVSAESAAQVAGRGAVVIPFDPPRVVALAAVIRPDEPPDPAAAAFRDVAAERFARTRA
jgi:DNA-binding transcriptional LysR family regulator